MRWSDHLSAHWKLILIIVVFLAVGGLYAVYTPAWQAPDEPAHYNYVRYVAENGRFPVLDYGDYPHLYLEQIKSARFPPDMSIAPLRYEFWQPPLYYLLATPVYRLFQGALLPLRLFSLAFGAGGVLVAYAIVVVLKPGDRPLALGTSAFVAFVPMHVTMMASVNNDALAEVLLALVMLLLIRLAVGSSRLGQGASRSAYLVMTGLLLGLGLVTKATFYIAIPLGVVALVLSRPRPGPLGGPLVALFGPALLVAVPWYVRNVVLYGWPDLLGTFNHDTVVVGQLRTADFLATVGWATYLENFLFTTFHSFWGQFGWMAVPMDRRIYLALGLFSALILAGLVTVIRRMIASPSGRFNARMPETTTQPSKHQASRPSVAVSLIALWLVLTSLMYMYYNLSLVQFQGRYLFPALIPFGLLGAIGLRQILSRRHAWIGVGVCGVATLLIGVLSALGGHLDKWGLLIGVSATVGFILRRWLPARVDGWVTAMPWAGLAGLSIYSLFVFIVPYLSP